MKNLKFKHYIVTILILTMLVSFTACSKGSEIDVVLWNTNGKPIEESVIEAHTLMAERFNQPGAIHFSAVSTISRVAVEEIVRLSTEQIWGEPKSDEVLITELKKLEERLNDMVNE